MLRKRHQDTELCEITKSKKVNETSFSVVFTKHPNKYKYLEKLYYKIDCTPNTAILGDMKNQLDCKPNQVSGLKDYSYGCKAVKKSK